MRAICHHHAQQVNEGSEKQSIVSAIFLYLTLNLESGAISLIKWEADESRELATLRAGQDLSGTQVNVPLT